MAGAVIVAWRCGGSRGCEKAAVARRRWPLEPACKGTAAPGLRLLLDCFFPTAVRCCRVRAAPGGGRLGWQDSGAGAAGECGGAARQPGARAGGGASPALGQRRSGSRGPRQPRVNPAVRAHAGCTARNLCGAEGSEFQGQRLPGGWAGPLISLSELRPARWFLVPKPQSFRKVVPRPFCFDGAFD